jgi:hypothetical protein
MVSSPVTARVTRGSRISLMQVTHIYATKPLKKGQLDRSKIISLADRSLAVALSYAIVARQLLRKCVNSIVGVALHATRGRHTMPPLH